MSGLYSYVKNVVEVLERSRSVLSEPETKRQALRWVKTVAVTEFVLSNSVLSTELLCWEIVSFWHLEP